MSCNCLNRPLCGCPQNTCCDNTVLPAPSPGCIPAPSCEQDHCNTVIKQQFFATLKVLNSWNIPACGGSAILSVPGLANILVGSYLWNTLYGYFEVISFNPTNGQVTIKNNCNDGNQPSGTQVPACTDFVVTPPPVTASGSSGQTSLFPYVAIDFTAPPVCPAIGCCITITLTTVNGLQVGKNVQIGSGVYSVSSISSPTLITICNDGAGITPGTPVIALNSVGQFQYPVILIDANPCTIPPVDEGTLLVCNTNIVTPLTGDIEGSVPVLQDPVTGEVQFEVLDVGVRNCTVIPCCFTIVNGISFYTIPVADSSVFVVGDILQIDDRTDRFTVTNILDATHIQGNLNPVPSATEDLPDNTPICEITCCEQIVNNLENNTGCFVQTGLAPVPPVNLSADLDSSPTSDARVKHTDFGTSGTPLASVTTQGIPDCNFCVVAHCSVVSNNNMALTPGNPITWTQLQLHFSTDINFGSRMVWNTEERDSDQWDGGSGDPNVDATDRPAFERIGTRAPDQSIMYHGGDMSCILTDVPGGTTLDLIMECWAWEGDNNQPATFGILDVHLYGWIEIRVQPQP